MAAPYIELIKIILFGNFYRLPVNEIFGLNIDLLVGALAASF